MDREAIVKRVNSLEWYHAIEIAPGIVTPGRYNPKPLLETMGFPKDLTGKTVLDIGTYDGYFTFEAERRGAKRVVAYDRHPADHLGFATAHELVGSKAEYVIGSVYDLSPETHGVFDVVLFLGVLYHLRHPLLALDRIHSVCREILFVESHVLDESFLYQGQFKPLRKVSPLLTDSPVMQFYPGKELNNDWSNWWSPSIECVRLMLETSGFRPRLTGRWSMRAAFWAERVEFEPPHWY